MKVFRRLWNDEAGFIISSELVLVATILVIGMIAGLTVLRDQVVMELADLGQAIGSVSQTYAYASVSAGSSTEAYTDGSWYSDMTNAFQTTSGGGGITISDTNIGKTGGADSLAGILAGT
jgi:hypothetical protein